MPEAEVGLRYRATPHQDPARVFRGDGALPIQVRNGSPGYINLLDALNSWQPLSRPEGVLGLPAAASFKHVSPAGAAVAVPMGEHARKAFFVDDVELSP